ncbi:MAG: haloacid dehalogenase-like hydrolase [Lachnospiraceae bacterium]|nr:haloacid dehalogenase-like hydrolase [Lachnospiraceae bacterium]
MKADGFKRSILCALCATGMAAVLTGCSDMGDININYVNPSKSGSEIAEQEGEVKEAVLEYWTEDSKAAASIKDYVERVTDEASPDYIPAEDRVAVFDMDGTLIGELYPSYFEYMMFIHRALYDETYEAPDDVKEFAAELEEGVRGGKMPDSVETRHAECAGRVYEGMTIEEFTEYTKEFMNSEAEGFNNLTRGDAFYKPMVSLVEYLDANDFECYIVSGSDRILCRALIEDKIPIPPERVIGMTYTNCATGQGDTDGLTYLYTEDDEVIRGGSLVIKTIKMNKVSEIAEEIGKVPVIAFGNSTGDLSMCQYTVDNDKYEGKAYIVLCDDFEREYGNMDKVNPLVEFCDEHGMETISMCEDFRTIYGDNVTLNREADNEIFTMELPDDVKDSSVVESRRNGFIVYDREAREADFGGYAFSVYAYDEPSEYAGGMDKKVGEIKDGDRTLYDIVIGYPSDVQYDYTVYTDGMPESYDELYNGADDIVKTISPKEGEFVWGAGCEGEDLYDDVLKKYVKALEEKWDSKKLEDEDMSPEYNAINVATGGEALKNVGYAYYDVNLDGVDELLIGEIADGDLKGSVYDIYTMVDREPTHVVSGSARNRYYALEHGMICNEASEGADETDWVSYDIEPNGTELLQQLSVKYDGYEDKEQPWFVGFGAGSEWESIDEEEFEDYRSRFEYIRFDFTPFDSVEAD